MSLPTDYEQGDTALPLLLTRRVTRRELAEIVEDLNAALPVRAHDFALLAFVEPLPGDWAFDDELRQALRRAARRGLDVVQVPVDPYEPREDRAGDPLKLVRKLLAEPKRGRRSPNTQTIPIRK